MKIDLIAASMHGGGAQRVIVLLATHFASVGHEVAVITFTEEDAFYIDNRITKVKLLSKKFNNHTLNALNNLRVHYKKASSRPDVLISFVQKMNFSSIIISKLYGIKVIACEHSNHLRRKNVTTAFTWNYLYQFADAVTVLTEFDKLFFERKGAKVAVMPNPSTFSRIKNDSIPKKKVILAVGNLDRYHIKGFDNLLELISPVLKQFPDWHLKLVGGGNSGLGVLKALAINHGIADQVVFTGFRTDVNILMQESEIFVLSSRFEGLPMVLLEAMSQGIACISYNCITGPSEIIKHQENGLLIEDQNKGAMKNGLIQLIEEPLLRKQLSKNALQSLDRFSIDNIYRKWEKLFAEITH